MARVEKNIEVEVPVRTAYNQWTQFEEFPQFMEGVHEVHQVDNTHLHWRAKVGGHDKEWDAEIREQVPDERIIWRATDGSENAGVVRFDPIGPARTRVHLEMSYDPEGFVENLGDALGVFSRRVEGDLQRFKDYIEARGVESGAYRAEHTNPSVPGGHTAGMPAQPRTGIAPAESTRTSNETYRGAGMEFGPEDHDVRGGGHSASGQPRDTIAAPSATYVGDERGEGWKETTVPGALGTREGNAMERRISGDGDAADYGEETPDVAGEYTGSSIPVGGMADPDREGRHHLETPGAMQPGSLSREPHQRAGMGGGPTADAAASGTHPTASGEGEDALGDPDMRRG